MHSQHAVSAIMIAAQATHLDLSEGQQQQLDLANVTRHTQQPRLCRLYSQVHQDVAVPPRCLGVVAWVKPVLDTNQHGLGIVTNSPEAADEVLAVPENDALATYIHKQRHILQRKQQAGGSGHQQIHPAK